VGVSLPHLSQLVETYLDQHGVQPVTIERHRYQLGKAAAVFGDRAIGEVDLAGDRRLVDALETPSRERAEAL
jgi:hypothetical protein